MISPIVSSLFSARASAAADTSSSLPIQAASSLETGTAFPTASTVSSPSFGDVLSQAIGEVNAKMQTAEVEKARVLSGESTNLHQAMLSIQEASVAFSLMTEVRNKIVESYQEIMRMQV